MGPGRSINRKGKICSLGLFLFSFELDFTDNSGITPGSQCISGKENQHLKHSYTPICACFHKRLVLDNSVGVIYTLPNYAVNRLVHFFVLFLSKQSIKNNTSLTETAYRETSLSELCLLYRFHIFGLESQVMRSKYNVFEDKPISYARNAGSEGMHVEAMLDHGVTALYCDL